MPVPDVGESLPWYVGSPAKSVAVVQVDPPSLSFPDELAELMPEPPASPAALWPLLAVLPPPPELDAP
jgi:hypothetical protein